MKRGNRFTGRMLQNLIVFLIFLWDAYPRGSLGPLIEVFGGTWKASIKPKAPT